jgi:hypothetical protein
MAGLQDIGVDYQQLAGADDWEGVTGGDGMIVRVDNSGALPRFYWSNDKFKSFATWSDSNNDGDRDAGEYTRLIVNDAATNKPIADKFPFVTNYLLNYRTPQAPQRVLIAGTSLWEVNNIHIGSPPFPIQLTVNANRLATPGAGSGAFTALAYGGVDNLGNPQPDVIYAAKGRDLFIRSPGSAQLKRHVFPYPQTTIVDIALDPNDWTTAYMVVDKGGSEVDAVFRVTPNPDGTLNWRYISARLPDTFLNTIVAVRSGADVVVLVGGRTGVNRAINPTDRDAIWTEFGSGLANAVVSDLEYSPTRGLYAATFGRGAWHLPATAAVLTVPAVLTLTGTAGNDNWVISSATLVVECAGEWRISEPIPALHHRTDRH